MRTLAYPEPTHGGVGGTGVQPEGWTPNVPDYDAWNRLVMVKNADGTLIKAYTYDGLGRRVTETTGYAVPKDFFYNTSWQLIEEKTGTTVNATYVWSLGYIDALLYRRSDADGNYYALYDA
jgi:YD repeat-containing protein